MISLSAILKDGISISKGITTSSPYTKEYGVAPVAILMLVLYAHKAYGNLSCQSPPFCWIIFVKIFLIILFVALAWPFPYG